MKTIKILFASFLMVVFTLSLVSFVDQKNKPWDVPAAAKNKANPKKSSEESLKIGKAEWEKNKCGSCHGEKGLGNAPKAKTLKAPVGDFSKDLKGQTDGELLYKTSEGRGDMPGYKAKIKEGDIWHVVNYMRSFEK